MATVNVYRISSACFLVISFLLLLRAVMYAEGSPLLAGSLGVLAVVQFMIGRALYDAAAFSSVQKRVTNE
ncbi:hypothetical protein G4V62_13385 [Bacillaceae bacterium SIJ1]|uniref:hypothetical protein n=1 Tax=Litoribacterium kuwaitense TaxID=1398745 RepID=UPI0013E9DAFE|nr:hypothetical protein [Litoribacterium kuwaitense]NGP45890.1 hypothetical protein [Litoribacterium kuwaitense]